MDRPRGSLFRGSLTLMVLAVFGAAMLITNAGAVAERKEASKKFVKKRIAKLRAADTSNAGRVAFDSSSTPHALDPSGTGTDVTQLAVQVIAPDAGFLVVGGSMDTFGTGAADLFACYVAVNGTEIESSRRWIRLDPPENDDADCVADAVAPVPRGTHTVALVVFGANHTGLQSRAEVLYASYVPYDGAGRRPT